MWMDKEGKPRYGRPIASEMFRPADELKHFGVLGMRWGHHKAQTSTSSGSNRKSVGSSSHHPQLEISKSHPDAARSKKSINQMSNAELQSQIKRLQLEKQYKELTTKDSASMKYVDSGSKWFGNLGKNIVGGTIQVVVQQAATKMIKDAIDAKFAKEGKSFFK